MREGTTQRVQNAELSHNSISEVMRNVGVRILIAPNHTTVERVNFQSHAQPGKKIYGVKSVRGLLKTIFLPLIGAGDNR